MDTPYGLEHTYTILFSLYRRQHSSTLPIIELSRITSARAAEAKFSSFEAKITDRDTLNSAPCFSFVIAPRTTISISAPCAPIPGTRRGTPGTICRTLSSSFGHVAPTTSPQLQKL